jgi:Tfp pilus assembly protein PilN
MIRINLLGIPKAKRGKRPSAPSGGGGEGPSAAMIVIVFIALLGGGLWGWYVYVNNQRTALQQQLEKAQKRNAELAEVKNKYEAEKRKAEQFTARVRVIDQLKQAQTGPVDLLSTIADTVSHTEAVWLDAMTDDGRNIDFVGMALSPDAVANLMANLEKTNKFKSVEIKETSQDNSFKELQAFKFELICEKSATGSKPVDAKTDKKS